MLSQLGDKGDRNGSTVGYDNLKIKWDISKYGKPSSVGWTLLLQLLLTTLPTSILGSSSCRDSSCRHG